MDLNLSGGRWQQNENEKEKKRKKGKARAAAEKGEELRIFGRKLIVRSVGLPHRTAHRARESQTDTSTSA
jgi:hypothetical protein